MKPLACLIAFSQRLVQLNERLAAVLRWVLIGVFVVLVAVVTWGVASRYLLGDQASWTEELARLLMVWLALLGAALVCREDRHLGMDVVVRSWTEDAQRIARLFVTLLVLGFAAFVMAWGGWQLVSQRFASGQTLPALGVSRGWFYLALPFSGVLTVLFMLETLLTRLRESIPNAGEEPTS